MPQPSRTNLRGKDAPPASLDHTQFRQYTSQLARWITPDPAGLLVADPSNPQSWNRYAYVLNNPMALVDPLGLGCVDAQGNPIVSCVVVGSEGGGWGFDWFGGGGIGGGSCAHVHLYDYSGCAVGGPMGGDDNGSARRRGNSSGSPANNGQQPKPCKDVPKSPPGASATFNANLVQFEAQGMWPATKLVFFDQVFRTGGTFDYKATGGDQYVDYGNWNYGYVCAANYGALFCQSAAGMNRMYRAASQRTNPFGSGVPFVKPPYGDQAADNQQIRNGIQAYQSGCVQ